MKADFERPKQIGVCRACGDPVEIRIVGVETATRAKAYAAEITFRGGQVQYRCGCDWRQTPTPEVAA